MAAGSLDNIQAIAHQEIQSRIPDTLIRSNALLNRTLKRFKKLNGGNEVIQFPIVVNENQSQGWIDPAGGVFDINPNQTMTYGQVNYKTYQMTSTITQRDLNATENSENAVIELVKQKAAIAFNSSIREWSSDVYGSGTNNPLKLNGFADIFAPSGTAYGGVLDTTYPSWLPLYDTTTNVISYSTINNMIGSLSEQVNQNPVSPDLESSYNLDLMLSKAAVQTAFTNTLQTQQRFMDEDLVSAGFKGVDVNGIAWVTDSFAPGTANTADNYLYILSTTSFHFGIRFGFGKVKESELADTHILPNQPLRSKTSFHVGNLWCENRRVNGVFKALNPSV